MVANIRIYRKIIAPTAGNLGVRSKKKEVRQELLRQSAEGTGCKMWVTAVLYFPVWEVRGRVDGRLLLCLERAELVVERLAHYAVAHRTISSNAILQFFDHSFLLSHVVEF